MNIPNKYSRLPNNPTLGPPPFTAQSANNKSRLWFLFRVFIFRRRLDYFVSHRSPFHARRSDSNLFKFFLYLFFFFSRYIVDGLNGVVHGRARSGAQSPFDIRARERIELPFCALGSNVSTLCWYPFVLRCVGSSVTRTGAAINADANSRTRNRVGRNALSRLYCRRFTCIGGGSPRICGCVYHR